jgi:hypothetical protein
MIEWKKDFNSNPSRMQASKEIQNGFNDMHNENKAKLRFKTIHGPGHADNLDAILIGKILSFELINNRTIAGKLKALGMYDIVITDSRTGQDILIMKSAIITIQGI